MVSDAVRRARLPVVEALRATAADCLSALRSPAALSCHLLDVCGHGMQLDDAQGSEKYEKVL